MATAPELDEMAAVMRLLADGSSDNSLVTPELAFAVGIVPCSECRDGHVRTELPRLSGVGPHASGHVNAASRLHGLRIPLSLGTALLEPGATADAMTIATHRMRLERLIIRTEECPLGEKHFEQPIEERIADGIRDGEWATALYFRGALVVTNVQVGAYDKLPPAAAMALHIFDAFSVPDCIDWGTVEAGMVIRVRFRNDSWRLTKVCPTFLAKSV